MAGGLLEYIEIINLIEASPPKSGDFSSYGGKQ